MTITCQAGTHGFNAITKTCDPMDDQYHGTHVAGTIGAVADRSFASADGSAGIAGIVIGALVRCGATAAAASGELAK